MNNAPKSIVLKNGESHIYKMGAMTTVFKADEDEPTKSTVCRHGGWSRIPAGRERTCAKKTRGVLRNWGTMSLLMGEQWVDADKGAFLRIPAKPMHDFYQPDRPKSGSTQFLYPWRF